MKEDISKLPRWVREKIEMLERDNEDLENKLREISSGSSDISCKISGSIDDELFLPNGSTITFSFEGRKIEVYMLSKTGVLQVRGLSGAIHVIPEASNSLSIKPMGWGE